MQKELYILQAHNSGAGYMFTLQKGGIRERGKKGPKPDQNLEEQTLKPVSLYPFHVVA